MITKTLILIGALIAVYIATLIAIIIVRYLKYCYLEITIKRGTHLLFKVDDKQYNLYNKGDIVIDKNDIVAVVISKSIDDKDHFYLYCKIIK